MEDDGASFDSSFDGVTPFRDTPEAGGISLESALRDFGPAALDDLIPRIRSLAAALDAAHAAGAVHGALHPSKVIISDTATSLIAGTTSSLPYIAPEVADGEPATAASDQYSLAAIVYEWLFGRPVSRTSDRPVDVRSTPGIDRVALSAALTRALAAKPEDRFASCADFCHRLSDAVVPELPLLAMDAEDEVARESAEKDDDTDVTGEIRLAPDFDAIDRAQMSIEEPAVETPVERPIERPVDSWQPTSAAAAPMRSMAPAQFGGGALILATIVGAVFGFAAGYMARPRALQTAPAETSTFAPAPGTDARVQGAEATPPAKPVEAPRPAQPAPAVRPAAPAQAAATVAPPKKKVPVAATRKPAVTTGVMVVESRPTGAAVTLDGRSRGTTPVTINDLPAGDHRLVMSMPGFRNFATTVRVVAGERVRAAASLTAQEQE